MHAFTESAMFNADHVSFSQVMSLTIAAFA
jgi:hypothetical protein